MGLFVGVGWLGGVGRGLFVGIGYRLVIRRFGCGWFGRFVFDVRGWGIGIGVGLGCAWF